VIESGRRRIGFIGVGHATISTKARYESYCQTIKDAGLEYNPNWIVRDIAVADMFKDPNNAIDKAVKQVSRCVPSVDAFFVLNDGMALLVLESLWKQGVKVPDDVAVVGMGDLPISGNHAIGLTTVREPLNEMGQISSEAIFELLRNPGKPVRRLCNSVDIKIRKTTVG